MSDEVKPRRWRAVLKTAVAWGVVWGTLGTAVASVMRLSDNISLPYALVDGLGMGIRIGIVGGIVGAAFAGFISVAYRAKKLKDISAVRFGIGGAVLGGALVPLWMETMSMMTGGGVVPPNLITDDIIFSTAFGGIMAFGSMLMAKRDEAKNPVTVDQLLDRMDSESLGAGDAARYEAPQRARSMEK